MRGLRCRERWVSMDKAPMRPRPLAQECIDKLRRLDFTYDDAIALRRSP
jgi:hypothetical protein